MFEIPEVVNFARQMNATLKGKTIQTGHLGNSPHKFVWYNRTPQEFEQITYGKTIAETRTMGRWLLIEIEPNYVLVFGEWGGRILFHQPGSSMPAKYHLHLQFDDDSFLTATTQMWGAAELYEKGKELERQYIKDMKTTPIEPGFSFAYFSSLIDATAKEKKQSVKGLLTQDQTIPGLGNAIAQDIMYRAGLHPRHDIQTLQEFLKEVICTMPFWTLLTSASKKVVAMMSSIFSINQAGIRARWIRTQSGSHVCSVVVRSRKHNTWVEPSISAQAVKNKTKTIV